MAREQEASEHGNAHGSEVDESFQAFLDRDFTAGFMVLRPQILADEERLAKEVKKAEDRVSDYKSAMKRFAPTPSDYLTFLVVLILAILVIHPLILHMGELFGWGFTDRLDVLLDSIQAGLTTAGGGDGLLHTAGEALWFLVEIIVAITVAFPLGILRFLQLIIPEAQMLMGIAEGLAIAAIVFFVVQCNPLVSHSERRKRGNASYARSADGLRNEMKVLREKQAELKRIRSSADYKKAAEAWSRQEEKLASDRRKLGQYLDRAK